MSWKTDIQNKFIITTGDGIEYEFLWKKAEKSNEYNTTAYDFLDVDGSYVFRGKSQGTSFPLELYFTGENCTDRSEAFHASLADQRALTMEHPFYGVKLIQPIRIKIENRLNVAKIILTVAETIENKSAKSDVDITTEVIINGNVTYTITRAIYTQRVNQDGQDIRNIKDSIRFTATEFLKAISGGENNSYRLKVAEAVRKADFVITDAGLAMDGVNSMIDYPFDVAMTIESRLRIFQSSLERLTDSFRGRTSFNSQYYYHVCGAGIISAMCKAAVTPFADDYNTRSSIVRAIKTVRDTYSTYITAIDANTKTDAGIRGNFAPDAGLIAHLDSLVKSTSANLIGEIQGAKVEYIHTAEKDTNIIVLCHRFYGLTEQDDSKLNEFIALNDFKMKDFIGIKKGTEIKYLQ